MNATLALIVSRNCNLDCVYCPVQKADRFLQAGVAVRAVRDLTSEGEWLVRLTGGEPTLNWPTVEALLEEVERLVEEGLPLRLELCTNGTLLDDRRVQALCRPWITVVVSVDGTPQVQQASGRPTVTLPARLLGSGGLVVTQTIAPGQVGHMLDGYLHLWEQGVRRFNFLPVYYVHWSRRQIDLLAESLQAVAEHLGPRVRMQEARVRNLERAGSVPLFNDDITVDVDGTVYRTNLVLADSITAPLLDPLRASGGTVPKIPPDIRSRLESLLDETVVRSMRKVDRVLDGFVQSLRTGKGARISKEHRRGRTSRPERLEFHISYECTNRCVFCSESHRLERWKDRPVTALEIRRTLLSHARAGGTHVNFTGGEPTLHPAFVYAARLAVSLGMRIYVGTNGARLADPAFASRVMGLLGELSLSVHGSTEELHDRTTGRRGSFQDLMRTRENARRTHPRMTLFANVVVTRHNHEDLHETIRLCSSLGVSQVLLSSAAPEGRGLDRYAELAVPLSWWKHSADDLAATALAQGLSIRFFGLPLCALAGARMKSNDLYFDPRVTVERARGARGLVRLSSVATKKPIRGRSKTRRCRDCAMRQLCGGVFRRYLELFGDGELEPIHE